MFVSDRLLTVLQRYLAEACPGYPVAYLRDSSGKKSMGGWELVLDADDPEEHDVMQGVFEVPGELLITAHPADTNESDRREMLGEYLAALGEKSAVKDFANDPEEARGIGGYGLHVFDFILLDGRWQPEDDEYQANVTFTALCMGMDRVP